MAIIIFKKLSIDEAITAMKDFERWFRENPKRKICQSDFFKVKRGYLVETILKHTKV